MNKDNEVKEMAVTLYQECAEIEVKNQVQYVDATNFLKRIKDSRKLIIEHFKGMKDATYSAWKEVCNKEKQYTTPIDSAEKIIKDRMIDYVDEQRRIQAEEERKAREKAEREAEKERAKLKEQEEKARLKAEALIEQGKHEQAEAMLERAEERKEQSEMVYAEPVAVESRVERTLRTDTATASATNEISIVLPETEREIRAFCKAVAEGYIPTSCVKFATVYIKQWAKLNNLIGNICGLKIILTSKIKIR